MKTGSKTTKSAQAGTESGSTETESLSAVAATPAAPTTEAGKLDAVAELLGGAADPLPTAGQGREEKKAAPGELPDEIPAELLLHGEDDGSGGEHDPGAPKIAAAPGKPPKTLEAAAEALGIEVKDLYEMQIGIDETTDPTSLGALKDAFKDQAQIERESVERSADLDQRETAMIAEQRLWGELGEDLATNLTPGRREQLLERLQERDRVERARMTAVMPELADKANFDQFRNDVVKELSVYGYKPHEVSIGDHRQLLVVRDLMRAKKRLAQLAKFRLKPTKQTQRKVKGRGPAPNKQAGLVNRAKTGGESAKVDAIANLIK